MSLMGIPTVYLGGLVDDAMRITQNSTFVHDFNEFIKPPFGPLNGFHEKILREARPLTPYDPWSFFWHFQAWGIPLHMMAYILVGKGKRTRPIRLVLAAIGLSLLYKGFTSYRLVDPQWNAITNIIGMLYMHTVVRYIEFALLAGPIVDPWMSFGRPRWVAAIDLILNQRMMYLGSVGLDTRSGPANSSLAGKKPRVEAHYIHKRQGKRPKTRIGAIWRHSLQAFLIYAALDTMYVLLRLYGPSTFGPGGGLGALLTKKNPTLGEAYAERVQFISMPFLWNGGYVVPKLVVRTVVGIAIPFTAWGCISAGYHMGAAMALSTGLWPVETWDVDYFDAPLRATSLIDLWGKRWHSTYRHHFTIMSTVLLNLLQIPVNSITIFPASFFFSGIYHALTELAVSPAPRFWSVVLMFYLSGLGCCLEVVFMRVTGRRVGGPLGWIWTWLFQANVGLIAGNEWLNAGYGECVLLPEAGVGEYIAPLLLPLFSVKILDP